MVFVHQMVTGAAKVFSAMCNARILALPGSASASSCCEWVAVEVGRPALSSYSVAEPGFSFAGVVGNELDRSKHHY
jgi:hypothetical protein